MEHSAVPTKAADDGGGAGRACDQCRLRKVRCDRQSPCANCTTAKYHCSFSGNTSRIREQRHRVLISSQYEKKIDDLERRLDEIASLVGKLAETHDRHTTTSPVISRSIPVGETSILPVLNASPDRIDHYDNTFPDKGQNRLAALADHAARQIDTLTVAQPASSRHNAQQSLPDFHGTSSVAAHASFAGQFIENALTSTTNDNAVEGHPNMRVALESLKQLLRMQRQHSVFSETHLQHVQRLGVNGLSGLVMPPLASVVEILRELRERQTVTFTLICVFDSIEAFTDMCKSVYFATNEISTPMFISVCTGLYYLFQEKAVIAVQETQTNNGRQSSQSQADEYRAHGMRCRDNLETALSSLSLLQPPKQETVEALIMAASYATEISKPSLGWQLNAAACQAVLAMGYHRKDYLPGETTDIMRRRRAVRFWFVYILDRALALRFGRSPNLPDYDITLPRQIGPLDEPFQYHCATIQGWLRHAEAQGQTYETLYSPAALMQPVEQRVQSARACAENLLEELRTITESRMRLATGNGAAATSGDNLGSVAEMLLKADEVSIRSTLTLVYRAIPPGSLGGEPGASSTFCVECVKCARDVVQLHFECIEMLERNTHLAPAYMHWTILFSPFIPFIVLFCHAIENCDRPDLIRMQKFTSSLEQFRDISEPVDRLYRLCEMLSDVAALYFESSQATSQDRIRQQQRQWFESDIQGGHMEPSLVGVDFGAHLGHIGNLLGIDDGTLSSMGPDCAASVESQAAQAANWYLDYVNMVGWSELSPSNWPR